MAFDYNSVGNIQMKKDNNKPQDNKGKGWFLLVMIAGLLFLLFQHNPKNTDKEPSMTEKVENFASSAVKHLTGGVQGNTSHGASVQPYAVNESEKGYQNNTDQVKSVKEYYPDLNTSNINF